nr:MAG TPA: hypothetical protein [Caudoviricetes sp.]
MLVRNILTCEVYILKRVTKLQLIIFILKLLILLRCRGYKKCFFFVT